MKKLVFVSAMSFTLAYALLAGAQVKKGKERPLKTKSLMAGLVFPNCGALGKAINTAPADDKAWEDLAAKAELLNEAGHILMADGRCPDATWAGATKQLRDGTDAVLKAIAEKNHEAAKSAFPQVTAACKSCHTAHRKQ